MSHNVTSFRRGYSPSPETRAKMRAAALVRQYSPETREKMRQSRLGKTTPPESRQKLSASMRAAWANGSFGPKVIIPDHLKSYARKLRRNGFKGKELIAAIERENHV